jgi:hypothetical protein
MEVFERQEGEWLELGAASEAIGVDPAMLDAFYAGSIFVSQS